MTITINLVKTDWIDKKGDGDDLEINYEVIPTEQIGEPNGIAQRIYGKMVVGISGSLQRAWI